MITYESDGERLADTTACAGVRADLKMCLLESDCCRIDKKTPRECLKQGSVPSECQSLRNTFFECKRSLTTEPDSVAIKGTNVWNWVKYSKVILLIILYQFIVILGVVIIHLK